MRKTLNSISALQSQVHIPSTAKGLQTGPHCLQDSWVLDQVQGLELHTSSCGVLYQNVDGSLQYCKYGCQRSLHLKSYQYAVSPQGSSNRYNWWCKKTTYPIFFLESRFVLILTFLLDHHEVVQG